MYAIRPENESSCLRNDKCQNTESKLMEMPAPTSLQVVNGIVVILNHKFPRVV